MRPENEWFRPEKLRAYLFLYEAIALGLVVVIVGLLASQGVLAEMNQWVSVVGGTLLVVVFGFLTWWIPSFVGTADYRLTDDELEYRRGVFFQQKTTVPFNRITNVNAAQGPIQRLVGAGSVGIHTAGYGGQTGAELTVGGVGDFEEIRDQILAKVRRRAPEATESGENTAVTESRAEFGSETHEVLLELRRIRELLEQGRTT